MKWRTVSLIVLGVLLALLLAACSPASPASQPPEATPIAQPQAGSHPPVILRVVEREEVTDGFLYVYEEISFKDPDGDATAVTYQWVSSSLSYPIRLPDEPIEASTEEQKDEALFTVGGKCRQKMELVFESRVRDRAGNLSEPVTFHMSCITPPVVDTRSFLINVFSLAIPIALLLVLGFWLLFRKAPAERLPVLRSTLLFFCLLLLLRFFYLVLHEGGHALELFVRGIPLTLYVHPFAFAGYARPVIESLWKDIGGSVTALPLSLLISLPFWKRRSLALLALVMLFPYVALMDGLNVLGVVGDFQNLVQTHGLSVIPFLCLGALILTVGIISFLALLPLSGLDPKDKRALFVIPAAMFLVNALSFLVAYLFVPGSPIDREYFVGGEILITGVVTSSVNTVYSVILAVLYVTLFRKIYPRLPAWLRTEMVSLTWKDLRIPSVLAAICVILGILIIT